MHYPTESDMPSNLELELQAIREGAAIAPITDRAFLRITGSDATRWLNGMVTNNIKDLAPGEGNYNFLLNAQGRIQGDCTIYREPGEPPTYLLETDDSQLETVRQTLDRFIIMDDVELTTGLQIIWTCRCRPFTVLGPKAGPVSSIHYCPKSTKLTSHARISCPKARVDTMGTRPAARQAFGSSCHSSADLRAGS